MGCQYCESKNKNNPPQNQHRDAISDDGYQPLNIPNQNQIKQNKTKKSEQLITPTPDPENLIDEPQIGPQNVKSPSFSSDVKNSNNDGERISQVSSVKNNPTKKSQVSQVKINDFKMVNSINAHDKIIVCMIELKNKSIVTGSYDNTIKIWDISNSHLEKLIQEEGKVFALLEFEPNQLLAAVDKTPDNIQEISQIKSDDIVIHCFNLNSTGGESTFSLTGHQLRVNSLVYCSDKFFASCSNDCNIIIWDFHFRKQAKVLRGHEDCILCMIRLNDGKLCSGGADMKIKIWDWENGNCVANLTGNTTFVKCLFELNNGYIISGSQDNLIKIWDYNYQNLVDLEGHKKSVRSICQIGTLNYIASASFDHTIKIWDLNTNNCVQTLTQHKSSVINVIFHSDGYLISCSNDKTIKIWK